MEENAPLLILPFFLGVDVIFVLRLLYNQKLNTKQLLLCYNNPCYKIFRVLRESLNFFKKRR